MSQTDPAKQVLPRAAVWSGSLRVCNDGGGVLEFSFDGNTVHGKLLAGETVVYRDRIEAGISVRGVGVTYRIEAW